MNFSKIPVELLVLMTILFSLFLIEVGYQMGLIRAKKQTPENDSVVSSISGYVLALIAFIMAFTFNIVSNRYDAKKALVREEANAIRTVWFRTDFLPDSDRLTSKKLLIDYVEARLSGLQTRDELTIRKSLDKCQDLQQLLWHIAVVNGYRDLNSDVGSLYVEALNEMINIHHSRVIISLYSRVPNGIWLLQAIMVALGMMLVGYMSGINRSKRSWAFLILAISFALVVGMVYTMDKLYSPFTPISQFAMEQLLEFMKGNM